MADDPPKKDWLSEFKKVNSPGPGPTSGSAPPTTTGRPERRKHLRFALYDATVRLYRRGATAIFGLARLNIEGTVLDLSEGGLRIVTGEQLLADTKVHLRVEIAKFDDKIESDGLVRWCRHDPKDESRFFAGIQFTGADPGLARKIGPMRAWFTSPQAVALREQRLREERRRHGQL